MSEGWVKLHRQLFSNEIWLLEPFTKAQAWIDLFANANHTKGSFSIRGNVIEVDRGQIAWSELTMAKRWRWSREKVRRYLRWLETRQQIRQQKSSLTTLITIVNYELYQLDETTDKTPGETTEKQQKNSRRDTNKNDKKNNNEKNEKTYSTFGSLAEEDLVSIADHYSVPLGAVRKLHEDMRLWKESKGFTDRRYANWRLALMKWVKMRIDEGKLRPVQLTDQQKSAREAFDWLKGKS